MFYIFRRNGGTRLWKKIRQRNRFSARRRHFARSDDDVIFFLGEEMCQMHISSSSSFYFFQLFLFDGVRMKMGAGLFGGFCKILKIGFLYKFVIELKFVFKNESEFQYTCNT